MTKTLTVRNGSIRARLRVVAEHGDWAVTELVSWREGNDKAVTVSNDGTPLTTAITHAPTGLAAVYGPAQALCDLLKRVAECSPPGADPRLEPLRSAVRTLLHKAGAREITHPDRGVGTNRLWVGPPPPGWKRVRMARGKKGETP